MKVLQINTVYGTGSTGRIVADIHKLLLEKGYDSYIAYGRGSENKSSEIFKTGKMIDNYKHAVLTRLMDKHGFGSKKSTQELISKIKTINPNIIHLHNIHGYYINMEVLFEYLNKSNKPVIWTFHDCWPFTGHCAYFDYAKCNKWRTICYNCLEKRSYPSSFMLDNSKFNYFKKKEFFTRIKNLTIITPSKWLAGLVKDSFFHDYPVQVINNGIDLKVFKTVIDNDFKERFSLNEKFVILGVANVWEKRKGLNYFIKLSKMIKNDEIIVLVGLTKKQIKQMPRNIIGITKTNNVEELIKLYTSADVFFNPTLEDNFPTTNLEALACGTPVITFNTGGSVESIDENTGYIVEQGNLIHVKAIINEIKEKGKEQFKEKCITRAAALFNKNDRFSDYIKLYESLYSKS